MNNLIVKNLTYQCSCQKNPINFKDLKQHLKLEVDHRIKLIKSHKSNENELEKSDSEKELVYSKKYFTYFTFKIISLILLYRSHLLMIPVFIMVENFFLGTQNKIVSSIKNALAKVIQ